MVQPVPMVEIWRGDFLENTHHGHAVVCDPSGAIVESWGDPNAVILPRSSSKMLQALPLIESGAADAHGLTDQHLALACASHNGADIHTSMVRDWLSALGLGEDDLRCGPQEPADIPARNALIRCGDPACQVHNNCSGKHSGFLTLSRHLGAGPEYIDPDHPVQKAVRDAVEETTNETSPGYAIDGCSAPNFASTMHGMARAMAFFAAAREGQGTRATAAARLRDAMAKHPEYVAGEGRACTRLMRAMDHKVAIKTGAEAYFIAILPEQELGIALKITDGTTRAAEAAIASLLVRHGALDPDHPTAKDYIDAPITNRRDILCGVMKPAAGFP
ncbi:asparaginase [Shimia aestuarii]|uniref:Asparaginase n=1 Tax=Shimia aestuarii TaxID=254406 RepID=A0A1I4K656_9RHOB|nr:asparaginase [Shimia aestuarii]SFL74278.1 asparaginase [Shimia aestuarii]